MRNRPPLECVCSGGRSSNSRLILPRPHHRDDASPSVGVGGKSSGPADRSISSRNCPMLICTSGRWRLTVRPIALHSPRELKTRTLISRMPRHFCPFSLLFGFRHPGGRPRGRRLCCKCSFSAVRCTHGWFPKGRERSMLLDALHGQYRNIVLVGLAILPGSNLGLNGRHDVGKTQMLPASENADQPFRPEEIT
jgi:hypothetical protein